MITANLAALRPDVVVPAGASVVRCRDSAIPERLLPDGNVYAVCLGDETIGYVYQRLCTFERKITGKRYVASRWQSMRWSWQLLDGTHENYRLHHDTRASAVRDMLERSAVPLATLGAGQ